ncbi:MAG: SAM-dependent methyltransferase [Phenylobacterium sp.]|uniref:small ribosomal subunit Rsm22 family protein n=1 Tax=Phenylobacterium sp. TaxID=1871053 RepID=UPI001A5EE8ED|nr:small ribosomal subunit Rsm22 family protein [Phenylobacterium sp.]MBL8555035.1 SAM-dependent methyltransferase [Phenylobacterium sp.]
MEPGLPSALKAGIDRELEGRRRADLAARTAATTAAYRAGRTSAAAIRSEDDALAYALARLPATYAAAATVFAEARRTAPGFAPATLLDAGSGPGGGSWAAKAAWPSLERIAWLDASAPFLALAGRLAGGALDATPTRGDLTAGGFPHADLVLASYALAEIAPDRQQALVLDLWAAADGVLALVEPGTPAGSARILAARDVLIGAGAAILAPCPHHAPCPLAAPAGRRPGVPGWCHFAVRLPRSRDHRLAKGADAPFEDEKFAYLLAARPDVAARPRSARVLARPRAGKPGIDLELCTGTGALDHRHVPRRDRPAHAAARRLNWGDAL